MIISYFHKSQFENMIDCFAMLSSPPLPLFPRPPIFSPDRLQKIKPSQQTDRKSRIRAQAKNYGHSVLFLTLPQRGHHHSPIPGRVCWGTFFLHKRPTEICTGCSLNIVFFFEDFKKFRSFPFLCFPSVSVYVHKPGR